MDNETRKALEQIATEESYGIRFAGGLTPYGEKDDPYDDTNAEHNFPGISLREVSRMLERAYELGRNSKPCFAPRSPMWELTAFLRIT